MKLTLDEILKLDVELNGVQSDTEKKGINSLKLSLKMKYRLHELNKIIKETKETFETLKNELIIKYGKEIEGGGYSIEQFSDETKTALSENFINFLTELDTLSKEEKTFTFKKFTFDDLGDLEIEGNIEVFFKLIEDDEIDS